MPKDATVMMSKMMQKTRPAAASGSFAYLFLATLVAWLTLAANAHAVTVSVGIEAPIAILNADNRTVSLSVYVISPTDPEAAGRLTYTWTSNLPVEFAPGNGVTHNSTMTATLPRAGTYNFSVLVQDPVSHSVDNKKSADLVVAAIPTSVRVTNVETQLAYCSIFSAVSSDVSTDFDATMLDQFGAEAAVTISEDGDVSAPPPAKNITLGVTWYLEWTPIVSSHAKLSPTGEFSIDKDEGVNTYAIQATMNPISDTGGSITYNKITSNSAMAQTNQLKIMFKPAQAPGDLEYVYDTGAEIAASSVGSLPYWGWNRPGIDEEAMRYREDLTGSQSQVQRNFALMQMTTYQRVVSSLDSKEVGSLVRDPNGNPIVDTEYATAPPPDNELMWRIRNLPEGAYTVTIMAGDPKYVGRKVDIKMTYGSGLADFVNIEGITTASSPWIVIPNNITLLAGQPLILSNGPTAERNLINSITIAKTVAIPN